MTGPRHHEGHHFLAPVGVAPADHRHLEHRRVQQQRLLDLARVDVGAARDDHVLGAVLEREETVGIEGRQVAGVQPATAQRRLVGGRVVPVTGHHHVGAADHLADLAGRQVAVVGIDHPHLDAGARDAHRTQALVIARVRPVGVHRLGHAGDGVRGLALAVHLHQAAIENPHRPLQVLEVHRRAAVEQRLHVRELQARGRGVVDHAHHDGRRAEEGHVAVAVDQVDHLGRIEAQRVGHHLVAAARDLRQRVQAAAVRQRRRVDHGVVGTELVDIGVIAQRHRQQVAMGERGALGAAGGAAGVEEPGRLTGVDRLQRQRIGLEERPVFIVVDRDDARQRAGLRAHRREIQAQVGRHEAQLHAAVLEDEGDLARVQLRVDRHDAQARVPARPHQLEIRRAVLHHQRDAVARLHRRMTPKATGQTGDPLVQLRIGPDRAFAQRDRGRLTEGARGGGQQAGGVHAARLPARMVMQAAASS